jgi:hypothetical protein
MTCRKHCARILMQIEECHGYIVCWLYEMAPWSETLWSVKSPSYGSVPLHGSRKIALPFVYHESFARLIFLSQNSPHTHSALINSPSGHCHLHPGPLGHTHRKHGRKRRTSAHGKLHWRADSTSCGFPTQWRVTWLHHLLGAACQGRERLCQSRGSMWAPLSPGLRHAFLTEHFLNPKSMSQLPCIPL